MTGQPRSDEVKAIFGQALEIDSPAGRAAFLDQACAGVPDMRQKVDTLLRAYADAGSFLEHPILALQETLSYSSERPTVLQSPPVTSAPASGRYQLVRVIGEGGMGTVYLAQQTEPVKRPVALKVIKPGMDSRQVVARFEAERQALALMDHPNIARVFDGGTTEDGRPFFAMELVEGIPITRYSDDHRLTVRQRLGLFVDICQAVQHAHQKGVIHRDLKPSNVLVAEANSGPVPKVIDFGLVKALEAGVLSDVSAIHTAVGTVMGTPSYMAPEQAEPGAADVDTRADVYGLGAILYELLTGTPPLCQNATRKTPLSELLREVREVEPQTLVRRLHASGELPKIAASRGTEPRRLTREIRGDLEWITMRCLEKDRTRRYATPSELAAEVQRYLNYEPVEVHPPSRWYRARMFARRYRKTMATAVAFVVLLMTATAVSTWQAVRATRAEGEARRAEERAEVERDAKDQARLDALAATRAEKEAKGAAERAAGDARESEADTKAFADFLAQHVLAATRPEGMMNGVGVNVTMAEALEKAEPKLDEVFRGRPRAEALARHEIGDTWQNLGRFADAERHLRRALELRQAALGTDAPETLDTMNSLAVTLDLAGRSADAAKLHEETLRLMQVRLGPDHPATLDSRQNLGMAYSHLGRNADAARLHEETIALREAKFGADHRDTLTNRNNLAAAYLGLGRPADAAKLLEATLKRSEAKLGPDHLETVLLRSSLAAAYSHLGRYAEAAKLCEEVLSLRAGKLGPQHPTTLNTRNNLAEAYLGLNRVGEAAKIFEETLTLKEAKLGPDHPETLITSYNLAAAYLRLRRGGDAARLLAGNLERMEAKLGPDHTYTLNVRHGLATAYLRLGRGDDAVKLFEQNLSKTEARFGPDHEETLPSRTALARAYRAVSRADAANRLDEITLKHLEAKHGPNHSGTITARQTLGQHYLRAGRYPEAARLLHDIFLFRDPKLPHDHPNNLSLGDMMVAAFDAQGEYAMAEVLHGINVESSNHEYGPTHPRTAGARAALGFNRLRQRKWADAEVVLRESLAVREKVEPDAWTTFNARSMLGGALLGQGKYDKAEPLLVTGYDGMKERETTIPPVGKARLPEAADRLVELYMAWNKRDEAGKWRAERAKYPPHKAPPPRPVKP